MTRNHFLFDHYYGPNSQSVGKDAKGCNTLRTYGSISVMGSLNGEGQKSWLSLRHHHALIAHRTGHIILSAFTKRREGELWRELLTFDFHLMNRGNWLIS